VEGRQMPQGVHRHMDLGVPTVFDPVIPHSGAAFGR
jgi:hypothetical protein